MNLLREKYIEFLRIISEWKNKSKRDNSFRTYTFRNGYKSQFYQDYIVANFVFPGKKDGIFLDIGGNHPIVINNTCYFEKIGWTGLAFEPQKQFKTLWEKHRNIPMLPIALGDCEQIITFNELRSDVLSGINVEGQEIYRTYEVQQRRLGNVLKERGICEIDYMSLDVEGFEMPVLNGIDWDNTVIKCISVECNEEDDNELQNFLFEKGYVLMFKTGVDGIYVLKDYANLPIKFSL